MKKTLTILSLIFLLESCGDDTTGSSSIDQKKEPTPEQKLAVIDSIYDTTDIKAIRIKTLVNKLATMYSEPKDSIVEYTYRAQSVLHDHGIEETCLTILEEINKGNKIDNTPYKDAITLYVLIRTN